MCDGVSYCNPSTNSLDTVSMRHQPGSSSSTRSRRWSETAEEPLRIRMKYLDYRFREIESAINHLSACKVGALERTIYSRKYTRVS